MIAVIGSSNMDIVFNVEHFTLPGETQKALSLDFYFGGKGANQAVAAAKLSEKPVCFCSCIGDDEYGNQISQNFKKYRIEGYYVQKNEKTGRAYIEVDKNGENRIIIFSGANDKVDKEKIDKFFDEYGDEIDICLLQNEIPLQSVEYAISKLKEKGITIIYDPAPVGSTKIKSLKDIDFLTPNDKEFMFLCEKEKIDFKESNLDKSMLAFKRISKVKNLIVKMGDKGVIYIDEEENLEKIEPLKVNPVDSTGAGDIFNGALAVAFSETNDLQKSLNFANTAAAISVERKGAQSSIPKREEVLKRLS
ncbi:ribokinase [Petrotoga mexicana DSM 14811]|uniref:Ribokinase n=1 Tax=Petrotoga mexicana DSM 14811 TaxID=1122954 RepID=A0A2K1P7I5_9BACT|nr:ribokinase [Petrotoga mexicana]PNR98762.1 ribokinase [Petrotoga mexicana DSM 14811]